MMHRINNWMARNLNYCFIEVMPRHSVRFAKQYFEGKKIDVIEVGLDKGVHAVSIFDNLNVKRFVSVDIWIKQEARNRLNNYDVTYIEDESDNAIKNVPMADFIYIDGDHSYKQAKKDMVNYWKKLRKGGVFAGHDIVGYKGVTKAFMEFCCENKLEPNVSRTDWWVVKK